VTAGAGVADHLAKLAKHDAKKNMHWDPEKGALRVDTPQALIQAVGYLKYARRHEGLVLFRGQNQLYGTMRPALYRGLRKEQARQAREKELEAYVEQVRAAGAFLENTPPYAHEAILQHYGIRTRWLDLVDNAWSALWFACHDAFVTGHRGQYLHYEPSRAQEAYIILIQAGQEVPDPARPGCLATGRAELIDLRRAAPSNYLRPHAQHAYLARSTGAEMEMSEWVVGIIAVSMAQAREWTIRGPLSEARFFFPSPYYDGGYEKLLKLAPESNHQALGSLHHVGA
jgi:FRG domain-containing protein